MDRNVHNNDEGNILIYSNQNEISFLSATLIREGVVTIKKTDGTILLQKVLSNSNYEHLPLPVNIHKVEVSIISDEFIYKKILRV